MQGLTTRFSGQLPQLILFDLDGTLVDSVPDLAAAIDQMLLQLGRPAAGLDKVRLWVGNGAEVLVRRALADALDASLVDNAEAAAALTLFLQLYEQQHDLTVLYPQVLATMTTLKQQGIALALVTNKPEQFLPALFERHGLTQFFDWVVGGDTFAQRKPDPYGINWVLQQAKVQPEQAVFVGDSRNDILAAKAAGVLSVALTYGYNHGLPIEQEHPDWIIDSLAELVQ